MPFNFLKFRDKPTTAASNPESVKTVTREIVNWGGPNLQLLSDHDRQVLLKFQELVYLTKDNPERDYIIKGLEDALNNCGVSIEESDPSGEYGFYGFRITMSGAIQVGYDYNFSGRGVRWYNVSIPSV